MVGNIIMKTSSECVFVCMCGDDVNEFSKGKTVKKYPLVIASKYNIPFLLHSPGRGEVRFIFFYFLLVVKKFCFI